MPHYAKPTLPWMRLFPVLSMRFQWGLTSLCFRPAVWGLMRLELICCLECCRRYCPSKVSKGMRQGRSVTLCGVYGRCFQRIFGLGSLVCCLIAYHLRLAVV